MAGNILAIPVACSVLGATMAVAPALAMLGTTCIVTNATLGAAKSIKTSLHSPPSLASCTSSLGTDSSLNSPRFAKKNLPTRKKGKGHNKSAKKKTNSTQKTGSLRMATQFQPPLNEAPVITPSAGKAYHSGLVVLALQDCSHFFATARGWAFLCTCACFLPAGNHSLAYALSVVCMCVQLA